MLRTPCEALYIYICNTVTNEGGVLSRTAAVRISIWASVPSLTKDIQAYFGTGLKGTLVNAGFLTSVTPC